jgi:predicted ribosomally synthesized peptide with nif11-like leader
MESSADLQKEVGDAYEGLGNALAQAHKNYWNRVAEIAKNHGFEVTADEVGEKFQKGMEELSDEQLDAVAGGVRAPVSSKQLMTSIVRLPGRDLLAGT